jgi:hypothetical protein
MINDKKVSFFNFCEMCEKFQIEKSPYQAILKNFKLNLSFSVVSSIFSAFAQSYIKLIIFP